MTENINKNINIYKYRFLSRLIIELKTPLSVGSGEKDVLTDSAVAKDANGLPYIPGTAIAGILRHAVELKKGKDNVKTFFGYQDYKDGQGSEIIFSSAQIVDENGMVVEGLQTSKSKYLKQFDNLPVRQHVRIGEKGVAEKHGKFDEEVVYKGTRFCFEIEMLSKNGENTALFDDILSEISSEIIRIGGGTRKGFGEFSVVDCRSKSLNLTLVDDLNDYINKTSSLNDSFWESVADNIPNAAVNDDWITYELKLQPDNFFIFSSGFGDDDADMTPVSETYFDWSSGKPVMKENAILIPGSSVKGALSHRTAFYYN